MRLRAVAASTLFLALLSASALPAQQVAQRLRDPAPTDSVQPALRLAPLPAVAAGGLVGGVIIGGAAAGVGAALLAPGNDDFIASEAIGAVLGFAVGYPIGVAVGTRYAAAPAGHRPSAARLLLTSALSAGLGALIWGGTGYAADGSNPDGDNIHMWYAGAAAGALVHLGVTSYVAWREARRPPVASPAGP